MPPEIQKNIPSFNNPEPKRRSSFFLPFGIILLLIVILSISGVWSYKYFVKNYANYYINATKNSKNIAATTTADQFADWKTYRNDEYGVEFKYPFDADISINNYKNIDWGGPGGHWQNLAKTIWEDRLKNKSIYTAGDPCKKEDYGEDFAEEGDPLLCCDQSGRVVGDRGFGRRCRWVMGAE